MGTNNVDEATSGAVIPAAHHNSLREGISTDVVPRNASAVPTDQAGSLGTSLFTWLRVFAQEFKPGNPANNLRIYEGATGEIWIERTDTTDSLRVKNGVIEMYIGGALKFSVNSNGIVWNQQNDQSVPREKLEGALHDQSSLFDDDDFDGGGFSQLGSDFPYTFIQGREYFIRIVGCCVYTNPVNTPSPGDHGLSELRIEVDGNSLETHELDLGTVGGRIPCYFGDTYFHNSADATLDVELFGNHVGVEDVRIMVTEI